MARTQIHPGEILAEELDELGVSPTELARQIRVPRTASARSSTANALLRATPLFASRTGLARARSSG